MRGRLRVIFDSAPATVAALLFATTLATTLAPSVHAQAARRQTRDGSTRPPSSSTQSARAQTPRAGETNSREVQTNTRAEDSGVEPDLSITARVTADSLRFEKVPNPKVEFTGRPRRDTVWQSERENLPEQVQPGVTYRNIGITLRITSVFADIDRIVAEALGEVPLSDDARPTSTPPAQPASTPPAQPDARSDAPNDARPLAVSKLQEPRNAPAPSPARAATRANARGRAERRGRQR
jgi:hypothetical protein